MELSLPKDIHPPPAWRGTPPHAAWTQKGGGKAPLSPCQAGQVVRPCPLTLYRGDTLPSSPCHAGRWHPAFFPMPCRQMAKPCPFPHNTWARWRGFAPFPCAMPPSPMHHNMGLGGKALPFPLCHAGQAARSYSLPLPYAGWRQGPASSPTLYMPGSEALLLSTMLGEQNFGGKTGQGPNPAARILKTLALAFYCLKRSDHFINL